MKFLLIISQLIFLCYVVSCEYTENVIENVDCNGINYVPDQDCKYYWVCSNGRAIKLECPDNLCFNKNFKNCMGDDDGCTDGATLLPDYTNCSRFYQCSNGRKVQMLCPNDLWFNYKSNQCDYIKNYPMKSACGDERCPFGSTQRFSVDQDATKYIQCVQGYAVVLSCCNTPNFKADDPCYFDASTQQCVTKYECPKCVQSCEKNEKIFVDERDCSLVYRCETNINLRCIGSCFSGDSFECATGIVRNEPMKVITI